MADAHSIHQDNTESEITTDDALQITEEELQKALNELEGLKDPVEPQSKIQPIQLTGNAMQTIQQLLSDRLKKSMVSNTDLQEISQLIGTHVDRNLSIISKSIDAANMRDESIARVLKNINTSMGNIETALGKVMNEPVVSATHGSVSMADVVQKNPTNSNESPEQDPRVLKKSIVGGLSKLIRKETVGSSEGQRLTDVMINFETTGKISDYDIKKAMNVTQGE